MASACEPAVRSSALFDSPRHPLVILRQASPSMHCRAAVNDERLAGDEITLWRGEEDRRPTMSSGVCTRLSARSSFAAVRMRMTSSPGFASESVLPGAMQLTQMPCSPTSRASTRVKPDDAGL